MKKFASLLVFSVLLNVQPVFAGSHGEESAVGPVKALEMLMDGNHRFASNGNVSHLRKMVSAKRRAETAHGQKPFAVVVACADSRVAPELLFDQGIGEIFVIRVAGNIAGAHELGSIEYAVEHLGVKLVMILGHEHCGAVTATYDAHVAGSKVPGNIGSLVDAIDPAVSATLAKGDQGSKDATIADCINENVRMVAGQLESDSSIIREAVEKDGVKIVKACYDLDDGTVTLFN